TNRIFGDPVRAAVHAFRDARGDELPCGAVVGGFVGARVVDADVLQIDGDVASAGIEVRRLNVPDGAPRRQVRNIFGDVAPVSTGVFGDVDLTVVAAGPNHAGFHRRFSDGVECGAVIGDKIIGADASGILLMLGIVCGEIGADDFPGLSGVFGHEDDLRADVNAIVVVGRNGDGSDPVPAIFHFCGRPAVRGNRPGGNVAGHAAAEIHAVDATVVAAGPDDVGVGGIGHGVAIFAAAGAGNVAERHAAAEKSARENAAGTAERRAILQISEDVIGNI